MRIIVPADGFAIHQESEETEVIIDMNPLILKMIAAPLIGAIIGYCTNWLAVKMLFRPREAKYIGKFRIPLTPGVIPKGKARLADAAETITNEQLLTKDAMLDRLLSAEVTDIVGSAVSAVLDDLKADEERTIRQLAADNIDEFEWNNAVFQVQEALITRSAAHIRDAGLGQLVAQTAVGRIYEELNSKSAMLRMLGDTMLPSAEPMIRDMVDSYIDQNAETILRRVVRDETNGLLDIRVNDFIRQAGDMGYDFREMALSVYKRAVSRHIEEVLRAIDAGKVVKDTINGMDNRQIENLVLTAMKNELGAVVNFGALIGLVIGMLNMVLYLL